MFFHCAEPASVYNRSVVMLRLPRVTEPTLGENEHALATEDVHKPQEREASPEARTSFLRRAIGEEAQEEETREAALFANAHAPRHESRRLAARAAQTIRQGTAVPARQCWRA